VAKTKHHMLGKKCAAVSLNRLYNTHTHTHTHKHKHTHTHTHTSHSLYDSYYSLLLHVSAVGYGHLQGATNFTGLNSTYCKQSYVNGKMYILMSIYT